MARDALELTSHNREKPKWFKVLWPPWRIPTCSGADAGSIRGPASWLMEAKMALNAPNMVMYLLALLLAIIGGLAYFGVLGAMIGWAFWLMAIAFIVLAVAVLVKTA